MPLTAVQDIFLGLGINFIQCIPLRSYNDTHFVTVALFVVTPGRDGMDEKGRPCRAGLDLKELMR